MKERGKMKGGKDRGREDERWKERKGKTVELEFYSGLNAPLY